MKLRATPLPGLTLIETRPIEDERGSFVRAFCSEDLAALRPGLHFPQINISNTHQRGTVRGMHFQRPPAAEAKLIRCITGRVFDVAVDLRADSPTYLRWHGVELAAGESNQVFIPEGFAHGFQTLSADVQLLYMHTAAWSRAHECAVRYNDPRLAINWPLEVTYLSVKDSTAPLLDDSFEGLQI